MELSLEGTHLYVLLMLRRKRRLWKIRFTRFIHPYWLKLSMVMIRYLAVDKIQR